MSYTSSEQSEQNQILDSSSEEDQIRLHTNKSKLQDILQKGRTIAPFLNKQQLITKFKNYYEIQSLFYFHLESLASSKNQEDQTNIGWIQNNKDKKTVQKLVRKKSNEIQQIIKQKYENYNFLEDQKILRKIREQENKTNDNVKLSINRETQVQKQSGYKKFNKSQIRQKRPEQNKKRNNKVRYVSKEKQQQKKILNQNNTSYQEKTQTQHQESKQNKNISLRYQRNYNLNNNKLKYVEKSNKEIKSNPKYHQKKQQQQKQTEKVLNTQENISNIVKQNNQTSQSEQTEQNIKIPENNLNIQDKQNTKIQQKINSQQNQKITIQVPKQQQTLIVQQKKVLTPQEIEKRFQKTCEQNRYVLKFIKPSQRVQKIQYILTGKQFSNVKVRLCANIS